MDELPFDRSRFEIVVGAPEYSPEFAAVCERFSDRLNIITVALDAVIDTRTRTPVPDLGSPRDRYRKTIVAQAGRVCREVVTEATVGTAA